MKTTFALRSLLLSVLASAQITETYNFNSINAALPDGNASGFADARTIVSAIGAITDVRVTLSILPTTGRSQDRTRSVHCRGANETTQSSVSRGS